MRRAQNKSRSGAFGADARCHRMNCVVVRTKLQAIIVKKMVATRLIEGNIHLVQCYQNAADESRLDVSEQCRDLHSAIQKTTVIAREKAGTPGMFLYFLYLLLKSRICRQRVYVANINWISFALALKLSQGQRIFTFDDGNANIQERDSSYLSQSSSGRRGVSGRMARWIFPNGCANFVRGRIERHCTIYPGLGNIVPESKLDVIEMDWGDLIADADRSDFPKEVARIFLGSVYPAINRSSGPITAQEVERVVQWSDLHIPHPRHTEGSRRGNILVKYPAESIISHYAKSGSLVVAHYNSSATLPFRHNSHVRLIDLMEGVPSEMLEK